MRKREGTSKFGFTLIELLIVIGLMALLSVIFIVSIRSTQRQLFNKDMTNLANDLRYVRNLAVSKAMYNGAPTSGYGVRIINSNGTTQASTYVLYANNYWNPANIIKTVTLSDVDFRIGDYSDPQSIETSGRSIDFVFIDDKTISSSGLTLGANNQYQLFSQYADTGGYMRSVLLLGEKSQDGFVWANIGQYIDFFAYACGNGIVEAGEECDDGNLEDDDGCDRNCQTEGGGGGRINPIEGEGEGGGGSGL